MSTNDIRENVESQRERSEKCRDDSFRRFLEQPMVRLSTSQLALPNEKAETLKLLLSAAHESGFSAGVGDILVDVAKALFKNKKEGA